MKTERYRGIMTKGRHSSQLTSVKLPGLLPKRKGRRDEYKENPYAIPGPKRHGICFEMKNVRISGASQKVSIFAMCKIRAVSISQVMSSPVVFGEMRPKENLFITFRACAGHRHHPPREVNL